MLACDIFEVATESFTLGGDPRPTRKIVSWEGTEKAVMLNSETSAASGLTIRFCSYSSSK